MAVGFCTCIFHLFPTHEWHCGNTYLSLLSNSKHPPHKFSPLISNKIPNWHVAGSAHLKSIPRSETEARTPALREVACYSVCGTSEDSCWKSLFSTARGGLSPSAKFPRPVSVYCVSVSEARRVLGAAPSRKRLKREKSEANEFSPSGLVSSLPCELTEVEWILSVSGGALCDTPRADSAPVAWISKSFK